MRYPKQKRYCQERFLTDNFSAYCNTYNRPRYGFAHEVTLFYNGGKYVESYVNYINRTWERFNYETALRLAIEKLPKNLQDLAKKELIDSH